MKELYGKKVTIQSTTHAAQVIERLKELGFDWQFPSNAPPIENIKILVMHSDNTMTYGSEPLPYYEEADLPMFDLTKALEGQLVLLRNGSKAQIMADYRTSKLSCDKNHYPLKGLTQSNTEVSWTPEGNFWLEKEPHSDDIVGMAPSATFDHWDAINPKYDFIAADGDGEVWVYIHKPTKEAIDWNYKVPYTAARVSDALNFTYENWETSLVERPE